MPWENMRYEHFAAVRADLLKAYAPGTVNKMLSHVRMVLKQAWLLGHMTAEEWERVREVGDVRHEEPPSGRALSEEEVASLMRACNDRTPSGVRDGAMLALMHDGALRRAEVASLDLSDLTREGLRVKGKGRKVREVPVSPGMRAWLDAWLKVRGKREGPLFYQTLSRAGGVISERMSDKAVRRTVEKRARGAGVENVTTHDLRRTALTLMLEYGADYGLPQKLAGHSSPATTARYDRRALKSVEKAMRKRRYPGPR